MATQTPRTFEVPTALVAAGFAPTVDLDTLDREVEFPGEFGEWAEKVLFSENSKVISDVCGDMRLLPRGILSSVQLGDDSLLIEGLVDSEGRIWNKEHNSWVSPGEEIDVTQETTVLDDDEVAFVARALREGADEVWFRPFIPKAFVSAVVAAKAPPTDRQGSKAKKEEPSPTNEEVPAGSAIVAVVDPIDEDAVLEMLAIAPGPRVLRRHDGNWFEDPEWVPVLTSVKPPKIVKLDEAQVASVSAQVDRSTDDQEWEPFETGDREQYQIFTASAYLDDLLRETQDQAMSALLAVAGREVTLKDRKNTERLKRYWTVGKGAAKIRWGTPGAWTRCHKHLLKYVGPKIAPGLCTNLSKRLGGPGVATHVTSSAEAVTAANPSGVNGYDRGMSFQESTGGVERDKNGRFAPEGGSSRGKRLSGGKPYASSRSERAARRRASMERSRAARREKENKKSDSEQKKRDREADQQKKNAQQQELANIALQISQATAAGDTIKAAKLRVKKAEKRLEFAETQLERTRAQTALNNARAALDRALKADKKSSSSTSGHTVATKDGSTEVYMTEESDRREQERRDRLRKKYGSK